MSAGEAAFLTDTFPLYWGHLRANRTFPQKSSFFYWKEHGVELIAAVICAEFQTIWDRLTVKPFLQVLHSEWFEDISGQRLCIPEQGFANLECIPKAVKNSEAT